MNVKEMTLRQKVGQLLMVGFSGMEPSDDILRMIEKEHIGGIILFGRNIGSPEEVLKLTSNLQTRAKQAGHPFPLLISTDQENGTVRRLGKGTTVFPGNMLLGAVNDVQLTRDVAKATAEELKALGINMNLAPTLDVNNNASNPVIGVRSFGEVTEDVTRHGLALIEGHREAGVITTAKHFPGHGDTDTDSHLALPTIPHELKRLEEVEFRPFHQAIKAQVDCMMIAHVFFPALEAREDVPATLSQSVVTGLLRETMGFDGVVTTDCLEMDAISKTIGTAEGSLQALKAGIDIVMVSHSYSLQKETIERIVRAVKERELREEIIDQAVERILRLKERYLSWDSLPSANERVPVNVGSQTHHKLAEHACARGVTLLKNDGILPLNTNSDKQLLVVIPGQKVSTLVEDLKYAHYRLTDAIRRYYPAAKEVYISVTPTDDEKREVEYRAQLADAVIFGTVNAHLNPQQADLVNSLSAKKQVIAVAMRNPYDLMAISGVAAYIATYEYTFPALSVAADIIFGKRKAQGKLPVSIPSVIGKGSGIHNLCEFKRC